MIKKMFIFVCVAAMFACTQPQQPALRQVISLNGDWQVAKTDGARPSNYASTVPVPGLVDMATPALDSVGAMYRDSSWYWYRKTLTLSPDTFDIASLKILKAMFHTRLFVNGQYVDENYFSYSPWYADLKPFLKNGENVIEVGVGTWYQLPDTVQNGHCYEKKKYIPGIFDDVFLTLSNKPYIRNIQCVPNIENGTVRIVAEIEADSESGIKVACTVREKASRRTVAADTVATGFTQGDSCYLMDITVPIKDFKLWSPDSPFLYEVSLNTGADSKTERFGMRSFRFDPEKGIALLNGEQYFFRGTNVAMYRFFEDPDRGALPWDTDWIVHLIKQYKNMHWDILRFHIGPAPERWYAICDSLGFLVQDEFAISGEQRQPLRAELLAQEFTRWMRDRWNHPCVVIWDANNESKTLETGKAIHAVRHLDLTDRPWDNGWAAPDRVTDPIEAHPYYFISYFFGGGKPSEAGYLKDLFSRRPRHPGNSANTQPETLRFLPDSLRRFPNVEFVNEYGWLWLNRDGSTTGLTEKVYSTLFGDSISNEQRQYLYARNLAMLTEFWRMHRNSAGVMHFCGLSYSRPNPPKGETSDNFSDLKAPKFEKNFYKYVRASFAPVGLMIDLWDNAYTPDSIVKAPVIVANDLKTPFAKTVTLTVETPDGKVISSSKQKVELAGYEAKTFDFEFTVPSTAGDYLLKAEYETKGEKVFSVRDIPVKK
jgi:hypothetical protein